MPAVSRDSFSSNCGLPVSATTTAVAATTEATAATVEATAPTAGHSV
jgi:hypothetical protein